MNKIEFANLCFKGLTKESILKEEGCLKFVVTVNAEFIVHANKDHNFMNIINRNFSTFDGQVPFLLAKFSNRSIDFEKLSGSDLIYDFCKMAKANGKKIYLLGGLKESNRVSVKKLKEEYKVEIDGFSPEYKSFPFEKHHNNLILNKIKKSKPDILFVGFGAVKQELWITQNQHILEDFGIKWVIGSGGTFEFVSGKVKRAPVVVQKIGLEGVYRLICEPKLFRLKRILLSFKVFKYLPIFSKKRKIL